MSCRVIQARIMSCVVIRSCAWWLGIMHHHLHHCLQPLSMPLCCAWRLGIRCAMAAILVFRSSCFRVGIWSTSSPTVTPPLWVVRRRRTFLGGLAWVCAAVTCTCHTRIQGGEKERFERERERVWEIGGGGGGDVRRRRWEGIIHNWFCSHVLSYLLTSLPRLCLSHSVSFPLFPTNVAILTYTAWGEHHLTELGESESLRVNCREGVGREQLKETLQNISKEKEPWWMEVIPELISNCNARSKGLKIKNTWLSWNEYAQIANKCGVTSSISRLLLGSFTTPLRSSSLANILT